MRHEPRLIGESVDQIRVSLNAIDGGQPQPFEFWRRAQDGFDELAKPGAAA